MDELSSALTLVMHEIVTNCHLAIIVLMLCMATFIVICIGSVIGEYFTEHRQFRVFLPSLVDDLKNSPDGPREIIKRSGLLLRQKKCLIELTRHPDITDNMRESMAFALEYREQKRYDGIIKITDLVARIAPMVGLLGTLIPLGPGIIALGQGDTETLSEALLTAFDTTALGLIVGGIALIISAIRGRWYRQYMVDFDTAIECVLEVEKGGRRYENEVSNEFMLAEAVAAEVLAEAREKTFRGGAQNQPNDGVWDSYDAFEKENTLEFPIITEGAAALKLPSEKKRAPKHGTEQDKQTNTTARGK